MNNNFRTYLIEKAGITPEEFADLDSYLSLKPVAKGDFVLQAGQKCRDTFFVEQGILRAYSIDSNGKEHIIQFASEDWFISDRSSLFFDKPSDFYIQAIEDSVLVVIPNEFFEKAAKISASFRKFNQRLLNTHILHMQKRIILLLGASAETRYLEFIKLYPDLQLRVSQWMISSYLGITPESLSRVRKELAERDREN